MFSLFKKMWTTITEPDGTKHRVVAESISPITGTALSKPTIGFGKARVKLHTKEKIPITKPMFYLSKSKIFRRRVGRIIYGAEGHNVFL